MVFADYKNDIEEKGFTVIPDIFSNNEIDTIITNIENTEKNNTSFRKSAGLFAIRHFLNEIPQAQALILNEKLKQIINELFGNDYFIVKSIYFDKPQNSNWFVSYHQDLTISTDKKSEIEGYGPWTTKNNLFAVQPPIAVLQNIYTVRIHLDDTDENNGALKVVPGSHNKEIYRPETINWDVETATTCPVTKGGIMIMKPLLLHSSSRTTNGNQRRVIHIEFASTKLAEPLNWAEKLDINL